MTDAHCNGGISLVFISKVIDETRWGAPSVFITIAPCDNAIAEKLMNAFQSPEVTITHEVQARRTSHVHMATR